MRARVIAMIVLTAIFLVPLSAATGQAVYFNHPKFQRSGVVAGEGGGEFSVFEVPHNRTFVLTDLSWVPGLPLPDAVRGGNGSLLYAWAARMAIAGGDFAGNGPRWVGDAFQFVNLTLVDTGLGEILVTTGDHEWPAGFNNTSGLVFEPGTEVTFEIELDVLSGPVGAFPWVATWSGYLAPQGGDDDVVKGDDPYGDSGSGTPAGSLGGVIDVAPNPVSQELSISFQLERPASHALIQIYDVEGRRIRTLHDGSLPQGAYAISWDGMDDGGFPVANGTYFARLETPDLSQSKKVTLMK